MNVALKSSAPADLEQIFEPIRAQLDAVEQAYARYVRPAVEADAAALEAAGAGAASGPSAVHVVDEVIPRMAGYVQTSGGKRVRPALLLLAARLAGYTEERAVVYASAVEFIHTATLVHDDIIDESNAAPRPPRGRTRGGGMTSPFCLGDYLYIKLDGDGAHLRRLDSDRGPPAVRRDATDDRGRVLPVGERRVTSISPSRITSTSSERKTAYLFGGSAEIGGRLGRRDDRMPSARRCATTASISASRSSSSMTCSTSRPTGRRSASRSAGDLRDGQADAGRLSA